jgi:hypothetical protein
MCSFLARPFSSLNDTQEMNLRSPPLAWASATMGHWAPAWTVCRSATRAEDIHWHPAGTAKSAQSVASSAPIVGGTWARLPSVAMACRQAQPLPATRVTSLAAMLAASSSSSDMQFEGWVSPIGIGLLWGCLSNSIQCY